MNVQFKTIRGTRWVFADGEEVGTINPMLSAAGKWAFIPIDGYERLNSAEPFKEILYGRTIGDVRGSVLRRNITFRR